MTTFPKERKNKNSISLSRSTLFRWYCIWVVKHENFLIYSSSQVCPNVLYGCTAADGYFQSGCCSHCWWLLLLLMVAPTADGCSHCWWLLPCWWFLPLMVDSITDSLSHCWWFLTLQLVAPITDSFSNCWWLPHLLLVNHLFKVLPLLILASLTVVCSRTLICLPLQMVAPTTVHRAYYCWFQSLLRVATTTDGCNHYYCCPTTDGCSHYGGCSLYGWLLPPLKFGPASDGCSHDWWLLPLLIVAPCW